MAPVLLLLVIAPLVAEFLLGDVALASLPALVLFIPLYGGGAVLIREVVRHRGGGWPAIVVLAAAYGVVEGDWQLNRFSIRTTRISTC
jgi:hypothetical protein